MDNTNPVFQTSRSSRFANIVHKSVAGFLIGASALLLVQFGWIQYRIVSKHYINKQLANDQITWEKEQEAKKIGDLALEGEKTA
ncbi:hypothetical protein HK097_002700 [Rhizophlyctis rosea]|uniref:Uncharacterized protein n=1 Tax=Rhizophlyctis rosea TaxID=64517 RepID=A0AAD5S5N7_9FUNG|nr:hypothetical protein HK097_002700 [Rhizophlyctis rosea]